MGLGSSSLTHRRRSKQYASTVASDVKRVRAFLKKGNCPGAHSALVGAAKAAGSVSANEREIHRKHQAGYFNNDSMRAVKKAQKAFTEKCRISIRKTPKVSAKKGSKKRRK